MDEERDSRVYVAEDFSGIDWECLPTDGSKNLVFFVFGLLFKCIKLN